MKAFILKILGFLLVLGLVLLFATLGLTDRIRTVAKMELNPNVSHVIFGHSHAECAYNDALLENIQNCASSGESYFYIYYKAQQIFEKNQDIKTVFIEFTNNQVNHVMDNWIYDDPHIQHHYVNFFPFLDAEGHQIVLKNNPWEMLDKLTVALNTSYKNWSINDVSYSQLLGGYNYLERNKTDSLVQAQAENPPSLLDTFQTAKYNLSYLHKLITLCQEQNIKVYLIRSPLHPKSTSTTNQMRYSALQQSEFAGCDYLDFSKFSLPNAAWGDLEHLNHEGAAIYSAWFQDLLHAGLLSAKDKQAFINAKIAASHQRN